MTDTAPYSIPKEPGRWQAIALAAAVHVALVAFLWVGIHWQSQVPVAVEAEVWSPEVREAAPPPPPAPEPTPEPVAKPEPKPVVKEAPPPPKVVEPVVPNPEIALEKERKRKAQEQKEREREEQAREDKERQRKADEQERKEQAKIDAEKQAEKQKAAAEAKKKAEAEEKKTAEAEAKQKQKQEAAKKAAATEKQRLADAAAGEKRHSDDMKRLLGQASGNGASNSTGTAAQSQGPRGGDPGYAQKVGAKIKNNIRFPVPDDLAGNPAVEYEVQLLPDGSVASIHLKKPSGVSGFDEAVKLAIERSAPYPKDKSGSVPSSFIGIHKPKDQ